MENKLGQSWQGRVADDLGGPCKYSGKAMDVIHDGLDITNAQFNDLAEDQQIVMKRYKVPSSAQNKLVAKLAPMQKVIVTK